MLERYFDGQRTRQVEVQNIASADRAITELCKIVDRAGAGVLMNEAEPNTQGPD